MDRGLPRFILLVKPFELFLEKSHPSFLNTMGKSYLSCSFFFLKFYSLIVNSYVNFYQRGLDLICVSRNE